jgi:gamma-glutamyltranspeptidase/glutathione hydrolase
VDAGVAAGLCINVTQADLTNIGGVAPLMMYLADSGTVETISGLGWWPKAATIDFFQREQGAVFGAGSTAASCHPPLMPG